MLRLFRLVTILVHIFLIIITYASNLGDITKKGFDRKIGEIEAEIQTILNGKTLATTEKHSKTKSAETISNCLATESAVEKTIKSLFNKTGSSSKKRQRSCKSVNDKPSKIPKTVNQVKSTLPQLINPKKNHDNSNSKSMYK